MRYRETEDDSSGHDHVTGGVAAKALVRHNLTRKALRGHPELRTVFGGAVIDCGCPESLNATVSAV